MDRQTATVQFSFELRQENTGIDLTWVMVKDPESQAIVPAVIHDREDAEGVVIDLVDGQVAAEVCQRHVEVGGRDAVSLFFPPPPPPSSGWWHRGRRPGGHATGSSWRLGRADHLPPPDGPP